MRGVALIECKLEDFVVKMVEEAVLPTQSKQKAL
jgi:hypothetical protein